MLTRWVFSDDDGVLPDWTFPINPSRMDAPETGDNVTINPFGLNGEIQDAPMPPSSEQWTFQGVLYTLDDHAAMERYLDNARPIRVTDHFGRVFVVMLQSVDTARKPSRRYPAKHSYTARAIMLGRLS